MTLFITKKQQNTKCWAKLFWSLAFLLLIPLVAQSQNDTKATEAENSLELLNQHLNNSQLDSVLHYANELKKYAKEHQRYAYLAQANYFLGRYYMNIGSLDSSIYYLKTSAALFYQENDTLYIGKSNFLIAVDYTFLGEMDSSMQYYHIGDQWLTYANDSAWVSVINNHWSISCFELGNYSQALACSQKSLNYLKYSTDKESLGGIYNTIGNIYRKMKEVKKEEQAYLSAIDLLEEIPESIQLGMVYNNLAEIYFNQDKIELGFETLGKAKECYETVDYPLGMCAYYAVLSLHYSHSNPPQYQKIISLSNKSIAIAKQHKDYRQQADAISFLGKALLHTNQLNKAEKNLLKGYKIAEENSLLNELVQISIVLSQVYEKKNQSNKALLYLKIHHQYKDSLYNKEKIKEFTSLDLQYQFKQEQLNDSLKNALKNTQIQLSHKAEIKTQKTYFFFSIIISMLLIAFAIYFYYSGKRRKKANHLLKTQNQQIGEQKLELERSATQIQKAFKELQELDEFKQTFTSMLVHDLKNPLNILVNIEEFENESESERLELVKYSSHNMLNLVMNMLDINRAESEEIHLDLSETTVIELLHQAITITNYLSRNKEIKINIVYENNYKIKVDEPLLIRVFTNLLTNAIKFSPPENIITIKIYLSNSNKLRISIIDHGPGIAKENQQLIFEKFKQVKTVKSGSIASTGLGLTFCKLAINAHKWEIGVESQEGQGADFWIEIDDFALHQSSKHTTPIIKETDYKNQEYAVSEENRRRLKPYLQQLEKYQVSAITDIKKIIASIKKEKIEGINHWLEEVLNAVSSYNEEKFISLIKSLSL